MKRYIILLALVTTMALQSTIMAGDGVKLSAVGFKGGLNLAKFLGNDKANEGSNPSNRTGFAAGLFYVAEISPEIAVQPELMYSSKGSKYEGLIYKVDYLEVPILLKFMLYTNSNIKPALYAGPVLGYKVGSKGNLEGGGDNVEVSTELKSTDFGFAFGGGMDFLTGDGRITIEARYTLGLASIDDSVRKLDIKNGCLTFLIGYSIWSH